MAKKKSSVGKLFKDYPIIIVFGVIFFAGLWFGFVLGRQSVAQRPEIAKTVKTVSYNPPVVKTTEKPKTSERSVTVKPAPEPFYVDFFRRSFGREVKITPAPEKIEKPKITLVIDDIGYSKKLSDDLFSIKEPVTMAILPQLTFSNYFAEEGKKRGFETILHLPLEPESKIEDPGPGVITVDMNAKEVEETLQKDLDSVPGVVGINNHMGSLATQDPKLMKALCEKLKKRHLFFLDSYTLASSVAFETAQKTGVNAFKRNVFIDNEGDDIKARILEAAQFAKENGYVIAIGHMKPNTIRAIKEVIPELKAQGFEFSNLRKLPKKT
jgi:polysaccharide deacetylase 2 family uncharacterized protein YibQ